MSDEPLVVPGPVMDAYDRAAETLFKNRGARTSATLYRGGDVVEDVDFVERLGDKHTDTEAVRTLLAERIDRYKADEFVLAFCGRVIDVPDGESKVLALEPDTLRAFRAESLMPDEVNDTVVIVWSARDGAHEEYAGRLSIADDGKALIDKVHQVPSAHTHESYRDLFGR